VQELRFLLGVAPGRIPEAAVRTLSKFVAYKVGGLEKRLPLSAKQRLSMNRLYWRTNVPAAATADNQF
jgi:rhamnosyltransferase